MLELAFSLTDRTAHRDRPAYFREHATEIGDVLQCMPWMLEAFHVVCDRFLGSCKFDFEQQGDEAISAQFLPDLDLSPPSVKITVGKREAMDIGRFLLERCAAKEIQVLTLETVCASPNLLPETQLAVVRALISRKRVAITKSRFSPLSLSITDV